MKDALNHPTWKMGPKITVDSSTLMNKGLEVIEAYELFGVATTSSRSSCTPSRSCTRWSTYSDGPTIAQLSQPDMRLPIGYALAFPDRLSTPFGAIDWANLGRLDFEAPDHAAFPASVSRTRLPGWVRPRPPHSTRRTR